MYTHKMAVRRCLHLCSVIIVLSQIITVFILFNGHGEFNAVQRRLKLVSSHRVSANRRYFRAPLIDNIALDSNIKEQPHLETVDSDAFESFRSPLDKVAFDKDAKEQRLPKPFIPDDFANRAIENRMYFRAPLGKEMFDRDTNDQRPLKPFSYDNLGLHHDRADIASANRRYYHAQPGKGELYGYEPPITSPKLIVLMTQWRSGSSVVGELFNQNTDMFYLFEPLWPARKVKAMKWTHSRGRHVPTMGNVSRQILRELAHCKFHGDFVKMYNVWHPPQNRELCRVDPECALNDDPWFENFCRRFRDRLTTKVIRVDLKLLRPLVEDDKIDLKIIHLVRDPRGTAASRIDYITARYPTEVLNARRVHSFDDTGRLKPLGLLDDIPGYLLGIQEIRDNNPTVRGMCQWMRENAIVSPDLLPSWLQGRYHLVQYEDFAAEPLKISREIYSFLGFPLPQSIEYWIGNNTNAGYGDQSEVFSTRRKSLEAATHWVNDLSQVEIKQIERECADVLALLGYKPLSELKQNSLRSGSSKRTHIQT